MSRCDDGLLEAEFALFDRSEVLLSALPGPGIREDGYLTTAGFARARLLEAGVTADLARGAFLALRSRHLRSLARSPGVRDVLDQLGAYEAFEGGAYRAERGRYTGVWLDLDALAARCPLRDASILFQALHLLLVLDEAREDVPVRLLTARFNERGRTAQRTWHRVDLEGVHRLPKVLREQQAVASVPPPSSDVADVREEVLRSLRARAAISPAPARLQALATAIARTGSTPPPVAPPDADDGPVTERTSSRPASSPPRLSPAAGAPRGATLPPLDPLPDFTDLRRHTELLQGEDHLLAVARSLSALVARSSFVPDLAMLAARAWLAAGELGYARHFARMIVEDRVASDGLRIAALEVLEATPTTHESTSPPPPIHPTPVIVLEAEAERELPPGGSLPPSEDIEVTVEVELPRRPPRPEIVETLALPPGLSEDLLDAGVVPRTPGEARIAMTRLSRSLGRDYRLWYGTTLLTDVTALDAMQRHLRRRLAEGPLDPKRQRQLDIDLTRHGALLSEILARSLGAAWVDLSPEAPGHWAMTVPPGTRVWPIGRVIRFFVRGYREADLIAFFQDLERAASPAG